MRLEFSTEVESQAQLTDTESTFSFRPRSVRAMPVFN
jgi:hypothetical protein